jgi:hypothetical protein
VDIGNNGLLSQSSDYWTTEADLEHLFVSIQEKTPGWSKRRVMLYLHGGLNDEFLALRARRDASNGAAGMARCGPPSSCPGPPGRRGPYRGVKCRASAA